MKKLVFIICLCLVSLNVSAEVFSSCQSFQGRNGRSYCRSTNTNNWFRCFSWCDAQGLTFASIYDLCDYAGATDSSCPNFSGSASLPSGTYHTSSLCGTGSCMINNSLTVSIGQKTNNARCVCVSSSVSMPQ